VPFVDSTADRPRKRARSPQNSSLAQSIVVLKVRAVPYDRRMLATAYSRAQFSVHSPPVAIDVRVTSGLPRLSVVGPAEAAMKEVKNRVRSACSFHCSPGCVTANLAPGELPNEAALEALREPLGSGCITSSRAAWQRMPGKSG